MLQFMSEGHCHANSVSARAPVQINYMVKEPLVPKRGRVINKNATRDVLRPARKSGPIADWSVKTTVALTHDGLKFLTILVIKEAKQSAVR